MPEPSHIPCPMCGHSYEEERITDVINYLENTTLPSSPWWIKVKKDVIIVGHADNIQTILNPSTNPQGLELTRDEEI